MVPYHVTSGDPSAPPLVLAHSLATDLAMWDAVVDRFGSRFHVIRYDARGHGGTAPPDGPLSMDDLVSDVVDLLDHLGLDRVDFAGLSMGGMVGMGLALDHPERVRRLVVCDARADAPPAYRAAWEDRIRRVTSHGFESLIDPTIQRWFTPGFLASKERVDAMRDIVAHTTAAGYVGCARALQGLDYKKRLHRMTVPTLFLVGEADAGAPPEEMKAMHGLTPASRFVEIPGAGHISAVEQPAAVAAAMIGFLTT
jgi:3-oxoadipate enol-lactonase